MDGFSQKKQKQPPTGCKITNLKSPFNSHTSVVNSADAGAMSDSEKLKEYVLAPRFTGSST
jgi:hypothetical protein